MSVFLYSTKVLPATDTLGRRVRVTDVATGEQTTMHAGNIISPEIAAVMTVSGYMSDAITFHGERHGETFYIAGQRLV